MNRSKPEIAPLVVLARTTGWIAIDKPSGLPSRPVPGRRPNALTLLERWLATREPGPHPPGVIHRLGQGTSGVLLFSLDPRAHRALVAAFAAGEVKKEYLAVVRGAIRPRRGLIDLPLRRNASGLVVPDPAGQEAQTRYETLESLRGASLLVARPRHGRMHQIRVHLAARGVPVLGDHVYGGDETEAGGSKGPDPANAVPPAPRLMLHAWRLRLPEALQEGVEILEAEPPAEFAGYLEQCRGRA